MEKKVTILILILAVVIVTILIILSITSPQFSPSNSNLEECKTLEYNGENKINIVFFSDKQTAQKYSDYFLEISPFNQNKNSFNFFYIDSYIPKCELYKGIAILCYSNELIKKASSCPNDYIVVIRDEEQKIRSSAYMNVMSLNSRYPLAVFPHEFGHAFLTLAEEYVPASLPDNPKNCFQNCEEFTIKEGCYQGCSESNYFRSIDNGIMRTLNSESFGNFNEQLFESKINSLSKITAAAVQEFIDCTNQKYFLIKGQIISNEITILEKTIETGCVGGNGAGSFNFTIIKTTGEEIQGSDFNPGEVFTDSYFEQELSGEIIPYEIFILKVQIIENPKSLEIYKAGEKISEINLEEIGSYPCKNE
ncbi:MAG: hypothetical protein ABIH72_02750 [archaeon]